MNRYLMHTWYMYIAENGAEDAFQRKTS